MNSLVAELKNLLAAASLFSISDNSVCNCMKLVFALISGLLSAIANNLHSAQPRAQLAAILSSIELAQA